MRVARRRASLSSNGEGIVSSWGTIEPPSGSSSTWQIRPRTVRSRPWNRNRILYGYHAGPAVDTSAPSASHARSSEEALVYLFSAWSSPASARPRINRTTLYGLAPWRRRSSSRPTTS